MSISVRLRKTAKLLPFLMHRKCAQGERYHLQNEDLDWLVSNQCVDLYVDSTKKDLYMDSTTCQEKGCQRQMGKEDGKHYKHCFTKCQDEENEIESPKKVSSWLVG